MITIKTTVSFGLTKDNLMEYKRRADEYEKRLKEEGTFWGRRDSTTAIAISSQRYIEVKKLEETDEV